MKEFLQHSLLFDSFRWTDHREMQELYNRMLSEIPQDSFKPKTLESLKSHLRLFLCNLYIAYYYRKPNYILGNSPEDTTPLFRRIFGYH